MNIRWAKTLILVPVTALLLAGCGAISFEGTCSNGHCTGTAGPAGPNASVSPSASIPGITPSPGTSSSPAPTVTVTQYVSVVQQCLPDPTESQLEALQNSAPACLDLDTQQQDVFNSVIINILMTTPRSELHTQQGRDDWRDREVAAAVRQARQGQ